MRTAIIVFYIFTKAVTFLIATPAFSSGRVEDDIRNVQDFDSINFQTAGKVIIEQGSREYLIIEAPRKVIKRITTKVKGRTLYIGYRGLFTGRDIEPIIKVGMNNIKMLSISSAGSIEADRINAESLSIMSSSSGDLNIGNLTAEKMLIKINSSGTLRIGEAILKSLQATLSSSGDAIIAGEADELILKCSSSGNFESSNFRVEEAAVQLSSSGNAILRIKKKLKVDNSGHGILSYYGDPVLVLSSPDSQKRIRALGMQ